MYDPLYFIIIIAIILVKTDTFGAELSPKLRRVKRIVGGIEAAQPPEDDPVVFVSKNGRDARIYGNRDTHNGFYVFRGIRFGEPPLGRHRFQRPRAVHPEGNLNATKWGPPCPQPDSSKRGNFVGTEDCLFLNIFTPGLPDGGDGYPVLVWIHGGGFRRGAACQYEMRNLIKQKIVVVSIQYRLGSLGFLSTGTKDLPGNNGMFDMALATTWVNDYIEFFGGNPKKIVIFGHGSGASSALMLSLSKLTQSFFSGIIAMSGSILSHFAIDKDPMSNTKAIAGSNNCPTENIPEMIRCLQELPVGNLVDSDSFLENIRISAQGFIGGLAGVLGSGPVIDGQDDQRSLPTFLTQEPGNALEFGNFPKIPLLTGVIKDETARAIFGRYSEEVDNNLGNIPNFLNENLIKSLQGTIPSFGGDNSTWQFVPEAFTNYLNIIGGRSSGDDNLKKNNFKKVAEITTDALFNAPAFLTSQQWSKNAKTFLYSFDYKGLKNFGQDFLAGLPLVDVTKDDKKSEKTSGHGDELGYIFGRNSIFGDPLANNDLEPVDPEAEQVTNVFTEMIANFARNGEVSVPAGTKNADGSFFGIPSFGGSDSAKDNPFVSVTSELKLMENFRYCEMGLWAGMVQRLQSTTCGLFKSSIERIQKAGEQGVEIAQNIGKETVGTVKNVAEDVVVKPAKDLTNIIQGLVPGAGDVIIGPPETGNDQKNIPENKIPGNHSIMPNFGSLVPKLPGGIFG